MLFKDLFVQLSVCAIVVEGIVLNTNVKLFRVWASGSGGNVILIFCLFLVLVFILFNGAQPFQQFGKEWGHQGEICVRKFQFWARGL